MKKLLPLLLIACTPTPTPPVTTQPVCVRLPHPDFIYKQNAPLRDAAGNLTGYRKEITLIMNKPQQRGNTAEVVGNRDADAPRFGTCPWASADGHAGGRFRCTLKTVDVRRKAVANTGSPAIRFRSGRMCVDVPDAGRCYGSTKGLCNQLIK